MPNNTNPVVHGQIIAEEYEAKHAKGVSTTAVSCVGTTVTNVFGTTNGFRGTITGAWLCTLGATSQTVTLKGSNGATICTFTSASSAGGVVGPNAVLANTAIDLNGTITVASGSTSDTSIVYVTYKTDVA